MHDLRSSEARSTFARLRRVLRDTAAVFGRELRSVGRLPWLYVSVLSGPLAMIVMFLAIVLIAGRGAPALLLLPGLRLAGPFSVGFALVFWTGLGIGRISISRDVQGGTLEAILATPGSLCGFWLGKALFSWACGAAVYGVFVAGIGMAGGVWSIIAGGGDSAVPGAGAWAVARGVTAAGGLVLPSLLLLLSGLGVLSVMTLVQIAGGRAASTVLTTVSTIAITAGGIFVQQWMIRGVPLPLGHHWILAAAAAPLPCCLLLDFLLGRSLLKRERIAASGY